MTFNIIYKYNVKKLKYNILYGRKKKPLISKGFLHDLILQLDSIEVGNEDSTIELRSNDFLCVSSHNTTSWREVNRVVY